MDPILFLVTQGPVWIFRILQRLSWATGYLAVITPKYDGTNVQHINLCALVLLFWLPFKVIDPYTTSTHSSQLIFPR
jgi:hypothetical protein